MASSSSSSLSRSRSFHPSEEAVARARKDVADPVAQGYLGKEDLKRQTMAIGDEEASDTEAELTG